MNRRTIGALVGATLIVATLILATSTGVSAQLTPEAVHVSDDSATYGAPVINDAETVAFTYHNGRSLSDTALLKVEAAGTITTIATAGPNGSNFSEFGPNLSINNHGAVAFWTLPTRAGGERILYGYDGSLHTVAATGSQSLFGALRPGYAPAFFSINDEFSVAFEASLNGSGDTGIYRYVGPTQTLVVQPPGAPHSVNHGVVLHPTAIDVGFAGVYGSPYVGIYKKSGSSNAVLLAAVGSGQFAWINSQTVAMHESGQLYFIGRRDWENTPAVFTSCTTGPCPVSTPGAFSSLEVVAAGGNIRAFLGDGPNGYGIYCNGNKKVITVGDYIGRATFVTDLAMSREAVNANGQLVFWAATSDGKEGIYIVQPWVDPPIDGGSP